MKKILLLLGAVAALAAIAVFVLILNINPLLEKAKPQIVKAVSEAVNQPVELGDLRVQFLPNTAVRISGIKLAKGDSGSASLESLLLSTSLTSLLQGSIKVHELSVEKPELVVVKNPDGSISVGGITIGSKAAQDKAKGEGTKAAAASKPGAKESSMLQLDIKKARIVDGAVTILDLSVKPESRLVIEDLNVKMADIDLSGKGTVQLTASLLGAAKENIAVEGSFDLKDMDLAQAAADLELKLDRIDLAAALKLAGSYGVRVDGLSLEKSISIDSAIGLAKGTASVGGSIDADSASIAYGDHFVKDADAPLSVQLTSETALDPETKKPRHIDAENVDVKLGKNNFSVQLSLTPEKSGTAKVAASAIDLSDLAKFLPALKAFSPSGTASANLSIDLPLAGSKLAIAGTADLSRVGAQVAPPKSKEQKEPAQPISLSDITGAILFSKDQIEAKNVTLAVDQQPLQASAVVTGIAKPKSAVFSAESERFELGELVRKLQPALKGFEKSFLGGLKVKGTHSLSSGKSEIVLSLDTSQLQNLPLESLSADIGITPAAVKIKSSVLKAFQGVVKAKGGLQTKKQRMAFKGSAKSIDVGAASNAFAPEAPVSLSGTLESLTFQVTGDTKAMPKSLEGPADAAIVKGALNGVGIVGQALSRINQLPGLSSDNLAESVPEEHHAALDRDKTEFDLLQVTLALGGEKINLKTIRLEHPLYSITGSGSVGFDGIIDLSTQLRITNILSEGMLLKEPKLKLLLDSQGNLVFPVVVKKEGKVPLVLPDVEQLLKRAARNTAKEAAKRELEKVAPGLGGATKMLDSLFK